MFKGMRQLDFVGLPKQGLVNIYDEQDKICLFYKRKYRLTTKREFRRKSNPGSGWIIKGKIDSYAKNEFAKCPNCVLHFDGTSGGLKIAITSSGHFGLKTSEPE